MEEIMRIQNAYTDEAANAYSVSNYWLSGDDHLLTCPYDMEHKIRHYRMESHLLKCQKQHPDVTVATCPFNATHVLPTLFFSEHVTGCPDHRMIDPDQRGAGVSAEHVSKSRLFRACLKNTDTPTMTCRMFEVDPDEKPSGTFKGKPRKYTHNTNMLDKVGNLKPGRQKPLDLIDDEADMPSMYPKQAMMKCMRSDDNQTRAYIDRHVSDGSEFSMYAHGGVLASGGVVATEGSLSNEPVAITSGFHRILKGEAGTPGLEKSKTRKSVTLVEETVAVKQNAERKPAASDTSVPAGWLLALD
ncbi:hypothetical protein RvY_13764 [Ramazzottius varieornatus]|uniref:CHHC U11-48K-type domain-containing protein n=1 Tax=Ramazzottius varieornatus TaxID=947166 RepID=A0A1D1VP00_RAMVA|nr:hypothetical protein RvY_13764 [Ramazzottius varieornatus]